MCQTVLLHVQACSILLAIGAAQAPVPLPLVCVLLHRAQDEGVAAPLIAEWSRIPTLQQQEQQQEQQRRQQQKQQQLQLQKQKQTNHQKQQQTQQQKLQRRLSPLVPLAARVFEVAIRGAGSRQASSDRLARSQVFARGAAVAAAIHTLSLEGRLSLEAALQSRAAGRCLHEHLPLLSDPAVRAASDAPACSGRRLTFAALLQRGTSHR